MIEKLAAKATWTKLTVGKTNSAFIHKGDSIRIPNSRFPIYFNKNVLS